MTAPRPSRTLYIVLAVLLVLLPLLAILQYQWIGEFSQAEKRQLEDRLNQAGAQFAQDFDRELRRIVLGFQVRGTLDNPELADFLAQRFDDATATFPNLVRSVFVVRLKDNDLELQRLHASNHTLGSTEWPADLSALRENLEQRADGSRNPREPASPDLQTGNKPVFVIPVMDAGGPDRRSGPPSLNGPQFGGGNPPFGRDVQRGNFGRGALQRPPGPQFRGATIVELNEKVFFEDFMPAVVARHFASDGAEYRIAILSRGTTPQIVYKSVESLNADEMRSPDLRVALLVPEFGRGRGPGGPGGLPPEFQRGQRGQPMPGGPVLSSGWDLLVKHRSGSLDAAVASLRNRNLAISFSVLLLLASSVALVLVSSHRARALAQLQMDFVARVSHELRTPLAIIRSAAYNVAHGVVSDEKEVREYAAMVQAEGHRLSTMVDQILTFSRTESGHDRYDIRPIDVSETVENVVGIMASSLSQANCEVDRQIAGNLPKVQADERALMECLQNLLTNAMKYGRNGQITHIQIEARRADSNTVVVTVADSGAGIDPPDLPHIFEPFFRGNNARSDTPGSGLGLNLVRRMMDAQGGRVTVESEPGRGARFTLHLTAVPEAAS